MVARGMPEAWGIGKYEYKGDCLAQCSIPKSEYQFRDNAIVII
jgi:hypothetical protein